VPLSLSLCFTIAVQILVFFAYWKILLEFQFQFYLIFYIYVKKYHCYAFTIFEEEAEAVEAKVVRKETQVEAESVRIVPFLHHCFKVRFQVLSKHKHALEHSALFLLLLLLLLSMPRSWPLSALGQQVHSWKKKGSFLLEIL
jgi:hypothetical protein